MDKTAWFFVGSLCLAGIASAFILDGDSVNQQAEINRLKLDMTELRVELEALAKAKRTGSW